MPASSTAITQSLHLVASAGPVTLPQGAAFRRQPFMLLLLLQVLCEQQLPAGCGQQASGVPRPPTHPARGLAPHTR